MLGSWDQRTSKPDRERWLTPLIPAFRRQRKVDLGELKASLVYRVSSRKVGLLPKEILS